MIYNCCELYVMMTHPRMTSACGFLSIRAQTLKIHLRSSGREVYTKHLTAFALSSKMGKNTFKKQLQRWPSSSKAVCMRGLARHIFELLNTLQRPQHKSSAQKTHTSNYPITGTFLISGRTGPIPDRYTTVWTTSLDHDYSCQRREWAWNWQRPTFPQTGCKTPELSFSNLLLPQWTWKAFFPLFHSKAKCRCHRCCSRAKFFLSFQVCKTLVKSMTAGRLSLCNYGT